MAAAAQPAATKRGGPINSWRPSLVRNPGWKQKLCHADHEQQKDAEQNRPGEPWVWGTFSDLVVGNLSGGFGIFATLMKNREKSVDNRAGRPSAVWNPLGGPDQCEGAGHIGLIVNAPEVAAPLFSFE